MYYTIYSGEIRIFKNKPYKLYVLALSNIQTYIKIHTNTHVKTVLYTLIRDFNFLFTFVTW